MGAIVAVLVVGHNIFSVYFVLTLYTVLLVYLLVWCFSVTAHDWVKPRPLMQTTDQYPNVGNSFFIIVIS